MIIERLNSVNLRLKAGAINIGHSQLRVLGHLISESGVGIDPRKLGCCT